MEFDKLSRQQLLLALEAHLRKEREKDLDLERQRARLIGDLRAHEVELEVQNRELLDAKRALEAARDRYEDLYELAPVAYFTFDSAGFVLDLNVAAAQLLGLDRSEVVGRGFLSLVTMASPAAFWDHLRLGAGDRQPAVSELCFSTVARRTLEVEAASRQVLDVRRRPVAFRTSFTDITERKRVEAELKEANAKEERLRRRFEALDHGTVALTQMLSAQESRGQASVLKAIVDEARVMVGAAFGALGVGDDPEKPFSPWVFSADEPGRLEGIEGMPGARGVLERVLRAERPLRIRDVTAEPGFAGYPAGHPKVTSFLGVAVTVGGRPVGALFLADKREERAFSEDDERLIALFAERAGLALEVARLNDEVQAAVQARDNLLAVVSHDLRNPLQAILVSTGVLARPRPEGERRAGRKQLNIILRSTARMTRLLDDLLQAESIKAGAFVVDPRPEEAPPMVEEVLQELESLAAEKQVTLCFEPPPALPRVRADRRRVMQVLHNVVGNAIKFSHERGQVRVRVFEKDGMAFLAVADDGPGIAPENQAHLFDRFWRGSPGGSPGVGLGLFIARGIVEAHGGKLSVESAVGAGSTFTFSLPVAG